MKATLFTRRLLTLHTVLAISAAACTLTPSRAGAQTVPPVPAPTIITSGPYVINQAGYYQLGANINYNGTGATNEAIITVNAPNVTLDFAGHYISGPADSSASTLYGVYVNERAQVTIQNGTVSHCYIGILMTGNGTDTSSNRNERIQNMVISLCSYEGIDVEKITNADILNNRVTRIGGTTTGNSIWGIYAFGTGIRITGNSLSSIVATASTVATGIEVDSSNAGSGGFIYNNQVSGATYGIIGGKYQQNLTDNCTTPMSNGIDAGLNN